jgi:hypothetical protein
MKDQQVTMKKTWTRIGNNFHIREVSQDQKVMDPGIYKLNMDPRTEELYLSLTYEKFQFPYKI